MSSIFFKKITHDQYLYPVLNPPALPSFFLLIYFKIKINMHFNTDLNRINEGFNTYP